MFVNDFYEVGINSKNLKFKLCFFFNFKKFVNKGDNNVTKQLQLELKSIDWHLLILHYLGLDHIGHVEGPFSAKVPPKLAEMDKVIEKIHKSVPFVLITGDHGMRDTGGHGGGSFSEVNVPLVVCGLMAKCSSSKYMILFCFITIDYTYVMRKKNIFVVIFTIKLIWHQRYRFYLVFPYHQTALEH